MINNDESVEIDNALNRFSKICKAIGHVDCEIEYYLSKLMSGYKDRNAEMLLEEKKHYRAKLENDKAVAEERVIKAFMDYYIEAV